VSKKDKAAWLDLQEANDTYTSKMFVLLHSSGMVEDNWEKITAVSTT
jgi:hypothetical protein